MKKNLYSIPATGTVIDVRNVPAVRPSQVPFVRRFRPMVKNVDSDWHKVDGLDLRLRHDQRVRVFDKTGSLIVSVSGQSETNYTDASIVGEIKVEVSGG